MLFEDGNDEDEEGVWDEGVDVEVEADEDQMK